MDNLIYLEESELKTIYGGDAGDAAEALGIMTGSIIRWGPLAGSFVGSYKFLQRFF